MESYIKKSKADAIILGGDFNTPPLMDPGQPYEIIQRYIHARNFGPKWKSGFCLNLLLMGMHEIRFLTLTIPLPMITFSTKGKHTKAQWTIKLRKARAKKTREIK